MGRELILKTIKKKSVGLTFGGSLITLVMAFLTFAMIVTDDAGDSSVVFIVLFLIMGIVMLVFGLRTLLHPEKSGVFKKNPDILAIADEHFANIGYQDGFIVLSDRYISAKSDPTTVTPIDEVFLIYVRKQSTNFIPTGKDIVFETARGQFSVNIYGKKSEVVDGVFNILGNVCTNAKFGYTPDNMVYIKQARTVWQQNMREHNR